VITDTIYPAKITIENGLFKEITPITLDEKYLVDVEGLIVPGFIDSHIHIESSMLTPAQFAKIAVRHGTTAVVCDPHEIANVLGIEGVEAMIDNSMYDRECLVARGIAPVQGIDASYDFHFNSKFDKTPKRKENGTVDYWSIQTVEMVKEGQVIATYNSPVNGKNGMSVKGKLLNAKPGRALPPLTGKGFVRLDDEKTYVSQMEGKIELYNNRIIISQVHEINGDVGLNTGNIDFRGDVIIHGNVPSGAVVRATGNITIDGTVEGCIIESDKDVVIRGGMLGHSKGTIKAKGDLHVKRLGKTVG
jgi:uncharacterized protein (DUF342 family)